MAGERKADLRGLCLEALRSVPGRLLLGQATSRALAGTWENRMGGGEQEGGPPPPLHHFLTLPLAPVPPLPGPFCHPSEAVGPVHQGPASAGTGSVTSEPPGAGLPPQLRGTMLVTPLLLLQHLLRPPRFDLKQESLGIQGPLRQPGLSMQRTLKRDENARTLFGR